MLKTSLRHLSAGVKICGMRYRDNEAGEYGMFYAEWTDASPDVSAHTSGSTGMPKNHAA